MSDDIATPKKQHLSTRLNQVIHAEGHVTILWRGGKHRRLYIHDVRRRPLGYVDLKTRVYFYERREGEELWRVLYATGLIVA